MRFSLTSLFILSLAAFTACQAGTEPVETTSDVASKEAASPASATPAADAPKVDADGHEDNAPRIELAAAKELYESGDAVFVDTRSADAYNNERIKGAINIPVAEFEQRVQEVPKGKTIIAYCS